MSVLRFSDVHKAYGPNGSRVLALQGIDLEVERGQKVCLVGASGCGKTTLLSIAAGIERPDRGTVEIDGRCALQFQDHALLPWLTLRGNVELPLKLRGVPRKERREAAMQQLRRVRLEDAAERRPHEVSGGMSQRAALARGLIQEPDVLLLDEPFAALDAITRELLQTELIELQEEQGFTILFSTHDVREAVKLGDQVVMLSSRPARVIDRFPIELTSTERGDDAAVGAVASRIVHELRKEVARHA